MGSNIFTRAASGSERLYKVFWLLWVPFLVLTVLIRKHTQGLASEGIGRSSGWPEYIGYLAFGIVAAWLSVTASVSSHAFAWAASRRRIQPVIRRRSLDRRQCGSYGHPNDHGNPKAALSRLLKFHAKLR
jgi:hypothetical protein